MSMQVRAREQNDMGAIADFLAANNSERVARKGVMLDPRDHPALLAEENGSLIGVLTYVIDGDSCEVLTLHSSPQWRGAGSALIREIERVADEHGCKRLWLVTTNDNVDALRFYQRRGFRLAALHKGEVDRSRADLKPEIPDIGAHGIPLRDELELEKEL
jgi:ribosomal protein S18 acetylase RimI-like enzyme